MILGKVRTRTRRGSDERVRRSAVMLISPDASARSRNRIGMILLVATALVVSVGCNPNTDEIEATRFGPLAVVPGNPGGDQARIEGILQITEDCVSLDERGEEVLLVWPEDRTSWDAGSQAVQFQRADGTSSTLQDGDQVAFGGGGESVDEGGRSSEDWVAAIEWVAEPKPMCIADSRWFVTDLAP